LNDIQLLAATLFSLFAAWKSCGSYSIIDENVSRESNPILEVRHVVVRPRRGTLSKALWIAGPAMLISKRSLSEAIRAGSGSYNQ
jgi:hypothetical protein